VILQKSIRSCWDVLFSKAQRVCFCHNTVDRAAWIHKYLDITECRRFNTLTDYLVVRWQISPFCGVYWTQTVVQTVPYTRYTLHNYSRMGLPREHACTLYAYSIQCLYRRCQSGRTAAAPLLPLYRSGAVHASTCIALRDHAHLRGTLGSVLTVGLRKRWSRCLIVDDLGLVRTLPQTFSRRDPLHASACLVVLLSVNLRFLIIDVFKSFTTPLLRRNRDICLAAAQIFGP